MPKEKNHILHYLFRFIAAEFYNKSCMSSNMGCLRGLKEEGDQYTEQYAECLYLLDFITLTVNFDVYDPESSQRTKNQETKKDLKKENQERPRDLKEPRTSLKEPRH